jgi:7-cyano-7-deazaguanine synthase in queuosine biosynthesis
MSKILLANSGGLDSAIIARKLHEDGYEVHSLYVNSHCLGWEQAMLSAQETADRYCVSHKVIDIDWGYTPNHYEDVDTFVMYDQAVAQNLDPATLPRLWSGPPNMGMVIMSIAVSYAKTLGINECCGGFAGTRSQEMYDIYNSAQLANTNPRWRPVYHAPYGAMDTEEALAMTGYTREDFPWVSKSVIEEV